MTTGNPSPSATSSSWCTVCCRVFSPENKAARHAYVSNLLRIWNTLLEEERCECWTRVTKKQVVLQLRNKGPGKKCLECEDLCKRVGKVGGGGFLYLTRLADRAIHQRAENVKAASETVESPEDAAGIEGETASAGSGESGLKCDTTGFLFEGLRPSLDQNSGTMSLPCYEGGRVDLLLRLILQRESVLKKRSSQMIDSRFCNDCEGKRVVELLILSGMEQAIEQAGEEKKRRRDEGVDTCNMCSHEEASSSKPRGEAERENIIQSLLQETEEEKKKKKNGKKKKKKNNCNKCASPTTRKGNSDTVSTPETCETHMDGEDTESSPVDCCTGKEMKGKEEEIEKDVVARQEGGKEIAKKKKRKDVGKIDKSDSKTPPQAMAMYSDERGGEWVEVGKNKKPSSNPSTTNVSSNPIISPITSTAAVEEDKKVAKQQLVSTETQKGMVLPRHTSHGQPECVHQLVHLQQAAEACFHVPKPTERQFKDQTASSQSKTAEGARRSGSPSSTLTATFQWIEQLCERARCAQTMEELRTLSTLTNALQQSIVQRQHELHEGEGGCCQCEGVGQVMAWRRPVLLSPALSNVQDASGHSLFANGWQGYAPTASAHDGAHHYHHLHQSDHNQHTHHSGYFQPSQEQYQEHYHSSFSQHRPPPPHHHHHHHHHHQSYHRDDYGVSNY